MKKTVMLMSILLAFAGVSYSETIAEVQGTSLFSKLENKEVSKVEGVVTLVRNTKFNKGFFMQSLKADNDDRTSEGIYVENKSGIQVKPGDLVSVNGVVKEIYFTKPDKTQPPITSIQADKLEVIKEGLTVKPYEFTGEFVPRRVHNGKVESLDVKQNAMDYYESLEGLLVTVKDPLITGFKEKYGDITVVPSYGKYTETRSINGGVVYNNYTYEQSQRLTITATPWNLVDKRGRYKDNLSPNPGDRFKGDVTGVVYYEHGEYRLYPVSNFPGVLDGTTKPEKNEFTYNKDLLNVVSYNIENFSHIDAPSRVVELAEQVATILQTPDILGLIEVGDDDGQKGSEVVSAKENVEAIIRAIKNRTNIEYGYMTVNPINGRDGGWPEMHIRNVILYRKDTVKPVGFKQGDAMTDTEVINVDGKTRLTFNPGRIGNNNPIWEEVRKPVIAQFEFKGKNLFVIANHLKSKRADDKIYGTFQPVVRKSELVRNPQGTHINSFVKEILKNDPNADIVVLGDMNDFEFSKTIKNINGNELIDTISELPENQRYTYVYQGNSQSLDNIIINSKYKGKVNVDVIRVNSEFTVDQGSFSDHDPIFVQFKVD